MNKQIEELTYAIYKKSNTIERFGLTAMQFCEKVAEELINLGYQKVDKDRITLTKEQYIDLTLAKQNIFNMLEERDNKARKETAREIFKKLLKEVVKRKSCGNADIVIQELTKKYGVNLEEKQ